MVERQKPPAVRLDSLQREAETASVTLPDKETLSRRLHEAIAEKNHAAAEEKFIPFLLQYAGQRVNIAAVPALLTDALHASLDEKNVNFRAYADKYFPAIINAFIEDARLQKRAHDFLRDALNG